MVFQQGDLVKKDMDLSRVAYCQWVGCSFAQDPAKGHLSECRGRASSHSNLPMVADGLTETSGIRWARAAIP